MPWRDLSIHLDTALVQSPQLHPTNVHPKNALIPICIVKNILKQLVTINTINYLLNSSNKCTLPPYKESSNIFSIQVTVFLNV